MLHAFHCRPQDPKDKRRFILDDKMKLIFVHPTTMFNMNKQLSKHCKTSGAATAAAAAAGRQLVQRCLGQLRGKRQRQAAAGAGCAAGWQALGAAKAGRPVAA